MRRFKVLFLSVLLILCTTIVIGAKVEQVQIFPAISYGEPVDFCLDISAKEIPKVYAVITFPDGTENKYILDYADFASKSGTANQEGYCFKELIGYEFRYQGLTPKGTGTYRITFIINDGIEESKYDSAFEVRDKPMNIGTVDVCKTVETVKSVENVKRIDQGTMQLHGTEYTFGQEAKLWLQLLNSSNAAVTQGVCYLDIYTPTNNQYIEGAIMTNMDHDGIYFYDIFVPLISGVYPVVAKCYYDSAQNRRNASSYIIQSGVLSGAGPLSNTYISDGQYFDITTSKNGGLTPINRFNVTFNFSDYYSSCNAVSELLLTGLGLHWEGKWNTGTLGHNMNMYVFNYTSNLWISFLNYIPGGDGTATQIVSNSLKFKNVTKTLGVTSSFPLQIRFVDTAIDEGAKELRTDYLYASCDQLANQNYQEVKGSSEMHINNPQSDVFTYITLCDTHQSDCGMILQDTDILNESEGIVVENMTIINPYSLDIDQTLEYQTALGLDCTGILEVYQHKNGIRTSIYNTSTLALGSKENCLITLPIIMNTTDVSMKIEIIMDNYPKWEVNWAYDTVYVLNDTIVQFCDEQAAINNFTYYVPINAHIFSHANTLTDQIYVGCNRALDDLYYFYQNYYESQDIGTIGPYESYLSESRFYWPIIYNEYDVISTYQRNINQIETFDLTQDIWNHTADRVWNYTQRNLTYIPPATVDNAEISIAVWNYTNRNLTFYPTANNLTASDVWAYSTRTLTNYAETIIAMAVWSNADRNLTFYPAVSNLTAGDVWVYADRNLTYYAPSVSATDIWVHPQRNLTYYPDTTNAQAVWNYTARYIHGEII